MISMNVLTVRPTLLSACEMTYIVSSGALNSTHSLTHLLYSRRQQQSNCVHRTTNEQTMTVDWTRLSPVSVSLNVLMKLAIGMPRCLMTIDNRLSMRSAWQDLCI